MNRSKTFFEWEDSFEIPEYLEADIYVNNTIKLHKIQLEKTLIFRDDTDLLNIKILTRKRIYSDLIKNESQINNLQIEIKFSGLKRSLFESIIIYNMNCRSESYRLANDNVETLFSASRIVYTSEMEKLILKEWYGCSNSLDFYSSGFSTSKTTQETVQYKDSNRISYVIKNKSVQLNSNSFWIKLEDYKFKISIEKASSDHRNYHKYTIEYREKWGKIPDAEERNDISIFLSFIIGTKLVKFGESYFDNSNVTQKEYISIDPINMSLLYLPCIPFYLFDSRINSTDLVIRQIPKMMNNYFLLKEKYRLNEVLPSLYIASYMDFNFINYITFIEMFANIDIGQKPLLIPKKEFRNVLQSLNKVEEIPSCIKDKFQNLNIMGINKKVERLLIQNSIDFANYKSVFSTRGGLVHGSKINTRDLFMAKNRAKELLTIIILKKLNYSGFIRDFTNLNQKINIKDLSHVYIDS